VSTVLARLLTAQADTAARRKPVFQPAHSSDFIVVLEWRSLLLAVAGALAVALGIAHSVIGERRVVSPLCARAELPPLWGSEALMRRTIRFAWHLTSIAWVGAGALLLAFASRPPDPTARLGARIVAGTFAASAVLALLASRGRHPAWIVCLAIAVAAWLGARG
jgi:hypothetical protein